MNVSLWKSPCVTTYSEDSKIMLRAGLRAPFLGVSRGSMTTMIEFPSLITGELVNGRQDVVSLRLMFSWQKGHVRCFEDEKRLLLVQVLSKILFLRFIREFTRGVDDEWKVSLANHFKPGEGVQERWEVNFSSLCLPYIPSPTTRPTHTIMEWGSQISYSKCKLFRNMITTYIR